MRDPRYRFTDDVRAATRAIALRMVHAGTVAESPEDLHAWLLRTDDLRATLTRGGYGSAFTADDLFPLFTSYVAKAKNAPVAAASSPVQRAQVAWGWVVVGVVVIVLIVTAAYLLRS